MAAMMLVFAELERDVIAQRTQDALDSKIKGRHLRELLPVLVDKRAKGMSWRALALDAALELGRPVAVSSLRFLLAKLCPVDRAG